MRPRHSNLITAALVVLALCAGLVAVAAPPASHAVGYQIIRNPHNPIDAVDRQFLEDAFLKRGTIWPDGSPIRPVDLPSSAPTRRQFSVEILGRPVEAVRIFWQQRIFAGRELPPPELKSDAEVIRYVLREAGGVGYVSSDAALDGVKLLTVR